jgi:hypothetical protein
MRRIANAAPWLLMLALAGASTYGFVHERLFLQPSWSDAGRLAFLTFALLFCAIAAPLIAIAPRWSAHGIAGCALAYTLWWSGFTGPLAVLYVLGAFLLTGRKIARKTGGLTALLLGASIWMTAIWLALHFPVNRPWVYLLALAVPYVLEAPHWPEYARLPRPVADRATAAALAVLMFVLAVNWILVLKPEIGADALSMHLALPAKVAQLGYWPFDFQHYLWAVMPNGADGLYSAAFLLGGEPAARLLNFGFLCLTAGLVFSGARRWVPTPAALMAAALFASTPLAAVITTSLFVENVWTALLVGAALALLRYSDSADWRELAILGALAGAAAASKVMALAFGGILFLMAAGVAWRRGPRRAIGGCAALIVAIGAPVYVYAWAKTGNPVFPFANQVFRSPFADATRNFEDPRFRAALDWKTPYALTFRSSRYLESDGGGVPGFQFLLLLAPAAWFGLRSRNRRQAKLVLLVASVIPAVAVLILTPYLRYIFPALAMFSIVLAWLAESFNSPAAGSAVCVAMIGLNLWFLPAGGYYDRDFALFSKSEIGPYLEREAPARRFIDHLNRTAPGEPVAFFGTDAIAGLLGEAYSANWHSESYWKQVREAPDTASIIGILRGKGIRHVVAPLEPDTPTSALRTFFLRWLDRERGPLGGFALYRLRDHPAGSLDLAPLEPGEYEEREIRIDTIGTWWYDNQFARASGGSLVYSDHPGDLIRLRFRGGSVRYVFTRAFNRGTAEVRIDGRANRVNLYAPQTEWQSFADFGNLGEGVHVMEIRVTGERDLRSSGKYVDLDKIVVGEKTAAASRDIPPR